MTAISITIASEYIDAAMAAVSKEETRHYLNGVFIDARGYIAATNGHIAFAARCTEACAFAETFAPGCGTVGLPGVLVPHSAIAQAAKGKGPYYTVDRDAGGLYWLQRGAVRVHFVPVDGSFPDWTRIIPEMPDALVAAHYQPQYVAAMGKMAQALGGGKKDAANAFKIHQNGENPGLVTFASDGGGIHTQCCAVIMPMRYKGEGTFDRAAFLAA
jgi:predicted lipoprotein with Yx(FWY)xxD motif